MEVNTQVFLSKRSRKTDLKTTNLIGYANITNLDTNKPLTNKSFPFRLQLAKQHSKRDYLSPCRLTQNSIPNRSPQLEKTSIPSPVKLHNNNGNNNNNNNITMHREIQGKEFSKPLPLPEIPRYSATTATVVAPSADVLDIPSPAEGGEVSEMSLPSDLSNHSPTTVASPPMKNTTATHLLPQLFPLDDNDNINYNNNSNSNNNHSYGSAKTDHMEGNSAHKSSVKARSLKPLGTVDKNASTKLLHNIMYNNYPGDTTTYTTTATTETVQEKTDGVKPTRSARDVTNSGIRKRVNNNNNNNNKNDINSNNAAPASTGVVNTSASTSTMRSGLATKEEVDDLGEQLDETLKLTQLPDIIRDPVEYENYKNLLKWVYPGGGRVGGGREDLALSGGGGGGSAKAKNQKDMVEESSTYGRPLSKTRKNTERRPSSRVVRKIILRYNLIFSPTGESL